MKYAISICNNFDIEYVMKYKKNNFWLCALWQAICSLPLLKYFISDVLNIMTNNV